MRLELVQALRIETTPEQGRRITRLYVGDREIPFDRTLLEAVARLCLGGELQREHLERLFREGLLEPQSQPAPEAARLALAPGTAIDVEIGARPVAMPSARGARTRGVRPEESLPIDLYIQPLRLAALQRLWGRLRDAWLHLLRAAQSRGQTVDPVQAGSVLAALARHALGEDLALELTLAIDQDEPLHLRPVAPLVEDAQQYPVESLRFHGDRDAEIAGGLAGFLHRLGDPGDLAVAGRVLGLLGRGVAGDEAQARLGADGPAARVLLRQLLAANLLVPAPERPTLEGALADGAVLHLGHATLLARLGEDHVLFDPWFIPASRRDARPPPAVSDLPRLSAIFLTHHHWDHVNIETLLKLDKEIPVYLPRQRAGAAVAPRTERLLRALGFSRVEALGHGEEVSFAAGRVVAAPFHGEDPTRIGYVGNTYVIAHGGGAALVHVDSGTDSAGRSLVSTGEIDRLRARFGPLSPVFATRRQERGTLIEHGWASLLRPSSQWARPTENCCNDAGFLASLAAACEGTLALYSEGGADWYPEGTDFLRFGMDHPRDAVLQFGWDDLDTIRAAVGRVGGTVRLSTPGEAWAIGGGSLGRLEWA